MREYLKEREKRERERRGGHRKKEGQVGGKRVGCQREDKKEMNDEQ
mgnify:CR=1 FL=1